MLIKGKYNKVVEYINSINIVLFAPRIDFKTFQKYPYEYVNLKKIYYTFFEDVEFNVA